MLIRRIARPLLASVFVVSGFDAIRNPTKRAEIARPFFDSTVSALPNEVATRVPTSPDTLVRINGAVQLGAGLLLASSTAPRVASFLLLGSLAPTTVAGHNFWSESDPATRAVHKTQFLKNLSLAGGLMLAAVDTEGKPSLAWRGKRATAHATEAITAAVPLIGGSAASSSSVLSERASQLGEFAKVHAAELSGSTREHAELAKNRSAELAELAKQRVPELAEDASRRIGLLSKRIADYAPEIIQTAEEYGSKAADQATHLTEKARAKVQR